ncbi:MAG: type II secretion system protein GspN [SAR324 cluster bacterium]|nr:type II secretion system protein GspN [SAR324 cluster bacterium]
MSIGLLLILLLAFWGFKQNFPGKQMANTVSVKLSSLTGIPFEIQNFELGWTKIHTTEIALRTPKWLARTPDIRLLILEKIELPFSPIITSGNVGISGKLHEGTVFVSTGLLKQKKLNISLDGALLERIPLFSIVPYVFVSGALSFSTIIENFHALQQQKTKLPEGSLKGKITDTRIRIAGGTALLDLHIPELDLTEVQFELQLGPKISIKKFQLKGDLEGTIEGSIRLNEKNPQMSLLNLDVRLTPSASLKQELLSINTLLRSFQCGETISINIKGPLSRPNFPERNRC